MLAFEIIIIAILIWALITGFRDGIVVQVAGLAGLFAGVYLASRFGKQLALWVGIGENAAPIAGFAIFFVLTIVAVAIIGRLMRGMFKLAGLGFLDKIGGGLLSVIKVGLILSLLIYGFNRMNNTTHWAKQDTLEKSFFYRPMIGIAEFSFPFIATVRDMILPEIRTGEESLPESPIIQVETTDPQSEEALIPAVDSLMST